MLFRSPLTSSVSSANEQRKIIWIYFGICLNIIKNYDIKSYMLIKNIYSILQKKWDKKTFLILYRFYKIYLNLIYPIYIKINKNILFKTIDTDVIVSLTTFPARIKSVNLVIESLMRQTYKPKKIILWLASDEFVSLEVLPRKLLKLQEKGLDIQFCENLRSHKKYYFAMEKYRENSIITADDDTFYPEDLIENLFSTSKSYPDCVCATMVSKIMIKDGKLSPYIQWKSHVESPSVPLYSIIPIGCEGVLYPPHVLSEKVFDKDLFKVICFYGDDLWLKYMSVLNEKKVMQVHNNVITYINIISTQKFALNKINNALGKNDIQIKELNKQFPIVEQRIIEEE